MEVSKNSINNFSFLHWTGIIFVLFGHSYDLLGIASPKILDMAYHYLGLRILFVVSGYLVMESYKRTNNATKWVIKRVARIWPGLIICTLGTALLGAFFTTLPLKNYFWACKRYIVQNTLLYPKFDLPSVFVDNIYPVAVNGSLWSLPIEVMCYFFILPIMMLCGVVKKISERFNIIFGIIIVFFCYIMYILREIGIFTSNFICWGTDWFNSFCIVIYFVLGVSYSCYEIKKKPNLQWAIFLIIVYALIPDVLKVIIRPIVVSYAVFALAFDNPPYLDRITGKHKGYYSAYLWGFPIQQALISIFIVDANKYISPFCLFIFTLLLVLIVAFFVTKYIEEPISKWIIRAFSRLR